MSQNPDEPKENEFPPESSDEERLDAILKAALYRQDCPEMMTLSEYQLELLSPEKEVALKAHLDHCPHCQAELSRLDNFLAEGVPAATSTSANENVDMGQGNGIVWRYVKNNGTVIIRLLEDVLDSVGQLLQDPNLAFAGPRRGQSKSLRQFDLTEGIEDFEAIIKIETGWKDPTHCTLIINVDIPSRGGWPNLADTEVVLKKDDRIVHRQASNPYGQVTFRKIAVKELTQFSLEITPRRD